MEKRADTDLHIEANDCEHCQCDSPIKIVREQQEVVLLQITNLFYYMSCTLPFFQSMAAIPQFQNDAVPAQDPST